jgi:predicted dehydrogenase
VEKPLRIGFLGGGLNSAVGRCHQVASQMDRRWELVAGAFSRHPGVNQATGHQWGIDSDRVYDDWHSFLTAERGQIDAVAVLTPTPQHYQQIQAVLDAGFDVLSEKALANSSAEADVLHSQAQNTGCFLGVTMNYSGYPMVRELRRMIRDGELGEVLGLHVEMPQEGFLRQGPDGSQVMPQDWRRTDGAIPTVSLDLGTHAHHLLTFFLNEQPTKVVGVQAHHGKVTTVADYVSSLAKMPSGADVNLWFGKCVLGPRNGLAVRVYGDKASAQWIQTNPEAMTLSYPNGLVTVVDRASPGIQEASKDRYQRFKAGHPAGFIEAFANLYWDLADDLLASREGAPQSTFTFGADHAAAGLRMLEAITQSHQTEAWQHLSRESGGVHDDS